MLIDDGLLYADSKRNCVFYRNDALTKVAFLRGTYDKKFQKTISTGDFSGFWYYIKGENPNTIYISESPIDAISLYELNGNQDGMNDIIKHIKSEKPVILNIHDTTTLNDGARDSYPNGNFLTLLICNFIYCILSLNVSGDLRFIFFPVVQWYQCFNSFTRCSLVKER